MYFNTTKETGAPLRIFEHKSDAQEAKIWKLFKKHVGRELTASEVLRIYPEKGMLITSVRRALSNLKNQKFIEKTDKKREGIYGRPECAYRIYTGQQTLF